MITFDAKVYGARANQTGDKLYLQLADVDEACRYNAVMNNDPSIEFKPMEKVNFQIISIDVFRGSNQPTLQVRVVKPNVTTNR